MVLNEGETMPFVPLNEEEKKWYKPPCTSFQHNPPSHIVITEPMKWVCPACGHSVIVRPSGAYLGVVKRYERLNKKYSEDYDRFACWNN